MTRLSFAATGRTSKIGREWADSLQEVVSRGLAITPQDFGALGDGVTDDTAAFKAAIDHLDGNATGYTGAARLFIPKGTYLLSETLNIRARMIIGGEGPLSSKLKWSAGCSGIRVGRVNTPDATTGDATAYSVGGGDESTIENLGLEGGYAGAEGEYHGIELRARAYLRDLAIGSWQGDGVYSDAAAGFAETEGNSSCSQLERVTSVANRNGLYINGPDANVWTVHGCDFRSNRQWGVWDSSFLGNVYVGCHTAANGWDGALGSIPTGCTYNSNRYYVKSGQAEGASTNAPSGTTADNTWWGYSSAGGVYNGIVEWVEDTEFREGGSYKTDDPNARCTFVGCYAEGDQNPAQMRAPTLVLGGYMSTTSGAAVVGVEFDGSLRTASLAVAGYASFGGAVTVDSLKVGASQVVGARQAAIADHASDATVNEILAAMRTHGLIAT